MSATNTQQEQAALCVRESARWYAEGVLTEAIACLRRAVLLYAAANGETDEQSAAALNSFRRARAAACQLCGDYLAEAEERAEAVAVYQEAADLYALIGDAEADREARACAHKLMALVTALRTQPGERLYLLIAHYERQQRQIALEAGTEMQQAECCLQIARIFERRERPFEAVARYREALALYAQVAPTPDVLLNCAECHQRIAGVLTYALHDLPTAARHYRAAVALYTAHEPFVFGTQPSGAFCARALAEIEHRLQAEGLSSELPSE